MIFSKRGNFGQQRIDTVHIHIIGKEKNVLNKPVAVGLCVTFRYLPYFGPFLDKMKNKTKCLQNIALK